MDNCLRGSVMSPKHPNLYIYLYYLLRLQGSLSFRVLPPFSVLSFSFLILPFPFPTPNTAHSHVLSFHVLPFPFHLPAKPIPIPPYSPHLDKIKNTNGAKGI
jgi:hypothetical protein